MTMMEELEKLVSDMRPSLETRNIHLSSQPTNTKGKAATFSEQYITKQKIQTHSMSLQTFIQLHSEKGTRT